MLQEKTFNTGEVTLNYAEGDPTGPPLVLLHGFTDRWQTYQPIITPLYQSWYIYALDLRGHGKSEKKPGAPRAHLSSFTGTDMDRAPLAKPSSL